jgi:hypothetical protein
MQKAVEESSALLQLCQAQCSKSKSNKLVKFAQTAAEQLVMLRPNQNAEVPQ